jgi:BTB/POZ domain
MCVHTQPDHTRLLGSFGVCCPWQLQKSEWGRRTELLGILILSQAESALSLVQEREDPQSRINPTRSPLEPSDASDANLVIRSSDFVNFKVHKLVLAVASPFFKDLLSLPQPPDSESVDGLPVVQLSEDSELLSTLVSMLYPIRLVVPNSYDKVLSLLTRQW